MRITVIPAQVTTVEDTIAGNITMSQILLLLTPLFIAVFIYSFVPSRMQLSSFKVSVILMESLICTILALRIKGKIILDWIALLSAYSLRPRYYIFNKNDSAFRSVVYPPKIKRDGVFLKNLFYTKKIHHVNKPHADRAALESFLANHSMGIRYHIKKGGLYVTASKI